MATDEARNWAKTKLHLINKNNNYAHIHAGLTLTHTARIFLVFLHIPALF